MKTKDKFLLVQVLQFATSCGMYTDVLRIVSVFVIARPQFSHAIIVSTSY